MADHRSGSPLGSQDSEEHVVDHTHSSSTGAGVREQDRFLPIANVSRIMKRALPANAKIAKDAKDTVQECVSEFISFITSEASDKCHREKRKTINGEDLLWAMATLGFEDYVESLKRYLQKFRESEGDGRVASQGKSGADATSGRDGAVQMQMMQGGYATAAVGYPQSQGMWLNAWSTD